MSIGFIIFEIIDMDSLKYQGINTTISSIFTPLKLDIHLNIKVLTPIIQSLLVAARWIFT